MGASDIQAGGAYVELSARLTKLAQGLGTADKMLKGWSNGAGKSMAAAVAGGRKMADGMVSIGTRIAAVGVAALSPLILAGKQLADYGENIGKLASKTGMSTGALAGLSYQAESTGINVGAIGSAVKGMQRNIVGGSKESKAAFASLGLTAEKLKTMSPDEQFRTIADALARVSDSGQRAALAQIVFGKSGVELLPILEGGSAEMARMQREADMLGLVLGKDATAAATNLDTSLDRLGGGLKGLQLQLGGALAPVLTLVANKLVGIVVGVTNWVKENPNAIIGFAKMAAGAVALGGALVVVGVAMKLLLSGVVIGTTLLVGIGMALLAVTDLTGLTATGFGELFNSIRIGGTGLGTWFAAFGTWVAEIWLSIEEAALNAWGGIKLYAEIMLRSLELALTVFARAAVTPFKWLADMVVGYFNTIISAYNAVAAKVGGKTIDIKVSNPLADVTDSLDKRMMDTLSGGAKSANGAVDASEARAREFDARRANIQKQRKNLFMADPQDNKGTRVDTSRAAAALAQIGGNVVGALDSAFDGLFSKLNLPNANFEPAVPIDAQTTVPVTQGKTDFSSAGTFSGLAGGLLTGNGVFSQQLQVSQQMAQTLKSIDSKVAGAFEGAATLG